MSLHDIQIPLICRAAIAESKCMSQFFDPSCDTEGARPLRRPDWRTALRAVSGLSDSGQERLSAEVSRARILLASIEGLLTELSKLHGNLDEHDRRQEGMAASVASRNQSESLRKRALRGSVAGMQTTLDRIEEGLLIISHAMTVQLSQLPSCAAVPAGNGSLVNRLKSMQQRCQSLDEFSHHIEAAFEQVVDGGDNGFQFRDLLGTPYQSLGGDFCFHKIDLERVALQVERALQEAIRVEAVELRIKSDVE